MPSWNGAIAEPPGSFFDPLLLGGDPSMTDQPSAEPDIYEMDPSKGSRLEQAQSCARSSNRPIAGTRTQTDTVPPTI
jgi:hypothetical protein